jgi:hypothetical protein
LLRAGRREWPLLGGGAIHKASLSVSARQPASAERPNSASAGGGAGIVRSD